jgi:diguanylate cyclase (GGDEF)-like protein
MSDLAPSQREPSPRPPMSLVSAGSAEPYRRLAEIFHDVLSEQSLDALLDRIADTLAELIPYEDVHIYEADEAKRELIPMLARGEWADEVMRERFAYGEGITGWAVEHREPVLANQAHLDPRVRFVPGTPLDPEALIAVPLVARGRLKGTLNIYRVGEEASFTEEEFLLATRFGDAAALALDNAHIRARLEHQASTDALTGLYNHRAFHDRLRAELTRASTEHDTVALVLLDLDDFKKVNDVYGHGVGDQVLVQLADVLRGSVRATDAVCRIGGEEFGIVIPSGDVPNAVALAARLGEQLAALDVGAAGTLTVSIGIAVGPAHAANPRELVACAEAAMMTAKSRGDGLVVVFDETARERPTDERFEDVRSIAHLNMLQSLSGKLSRLNDVERIGLTIADELRLLIDYHNCRVFLREGDELLPVAFRGDLTSADPGTSVEVQAIRVGRGITGRVAETGKAVLTGDAARSAFGERIAGTAEIEESLLAVPLMFGSNVTGVIVISKLGLDQFDSDDLRLLEVLAGHASVALENARLYEAQRREAESATALLEFGRALAGATGAAEVAHRVVAGSARILSSPSVSLLLQDAESGNLLRLAEHDGAATRTTRTPMPHGILLESWLERREPFLAETTAGHPLLSDPRAPSGTIAVAPFGLDGRRGAIAAAVPAPATFGARELDLLGGIAQQAKIALQNAESYETLERTFLSTVEALVKALEARDEHSSSHGRTIADLALKVGHELGFGPVALRRLELGALLHDIGKLGIPEAILAKPAPLTDGERAVVESHPILGERILEPIEQLEEVRRIVRSAHENFDGTGYPDRLAGEEIPIESRIVLACDAYHAMTTDRPYRSSIGADEAKLRLRQGSGTQFDPSVVAALLRVL